LYILGISEIDNDAGAVLLNGAEVVCGINEERLSRVKRHQGFPYRSVRWIQEFSGVTLEEIDHIAIAKAHPLQNPERFYRPRQLLDEHAYFSSEDSSGFPFKLLNLFISRFRNGPRTIRLATQLSSTIDDWISKHHCAQKVVRVPHHYAHATCAYWASGYDNALAVTLDGQGEGVTAQVYSVRRGQFQMLAEVLLPHSLGTFYAAVTKALGFQPAKHEGKVTGLAAFCPPNPHLLNEVRKLAFWHTESGRFRVPAIYGNYPRLLYWHRRYGREQLAAAFQIVLEEVAERFVSHYVRATGLSKVVLAGGVVANVKLNQRIHQIPGVRDVFVFPHMADGGLGYGAGQAVYRDKSGDMRTGPIDDVYWGPSYDNTSIENVLGNYPVSWERSDNIAQRVAGLLVEGNVVAHFHGRMEFGPRALGNRSILYPTIDATINGWLNTRLHRSEFMPFAPVTLSERVDECYRDFRGAEFTAEFMTITFDCTDQMKKTSPAVVHVDGTARPQVIHRKKNPRYYDILKAYSDKTGIPSLVNTSFNMHEEPIVCSPDDAVRSFVAGELDYLAIGDFIVQRNPSRTSQRIHDA
jgi:carbamoyltransferase